MINWRASWAITSVGIRRLLTKKAVILLLFLAWAPALILGIGFFSLGTTMTRQSIPKEEQVRAKLVPRIALPVNVSALFSQILGRVATQDILEKRLEEMLPLFWKASLYHFVQMESWILLFLCLTVGPHLVTPDIRSKSLPLYFARPLSLVDYTLGKVGILFLLFAQAFILPSVFMLGVSTYFMPSSQHIHLSTTLIPNLFSCFIIILLFSLMLILSVGSSTKESWTFSSALIFMIVGSEIFIFFISSFIKSHPMSIEFNNSIKLISIVSILNDFNCYLSGINVELTNLSETFRSEWIVDPISGQNSRLGDMPLFGSGNPLWKSALAGGIYLLLAGGLYLWNMRRAAR